MKTSGIRMLGVALCFAVCGVAYAQDASPIQASPIQITNAVFQEVEVTAADGTVTSTLESAKNVVPGDEVIYQIDYRNTGDQPATDIAIDNPLPEALVFSGAEEAPTVVSVDGGQTFGDLANLSVIDAEGNVREARQSDITNLRWIVASLAPGASGKVTYRARVK